AVILSRAMTHLPWPSHFIPQTPVLHVPWLVATVLLAELRHGGAVGNVAVFHPLLGVGPGAGAKVGADVGLDLERFHVVEKLVSSEAIALDGSPGHFEASGALVARTDSVLPVVIR